MLDRNCLTNAENIGWIVHTKTYEFWFSLIDRHLFETFCPLSLLPSVFIQTVSGSRPRLFSRPTPSCQSDTTDTIANSHKRTTCTSAHEGCSERERESESERRRCSERNCGGMKSLSKRALLSVFVSFLLLRCCSPSSSRTASSRFCSSSSRYLTLWIHPPHTVRCAFLRSISSSAWHSGGSRLRGRTAFMGLSVTQVIAFEIYLHIIFHSPWLRV